MMSPMFVQNGQTFIQEIDGEDDSNMNHDSTKQAQPIYGNLLIGQPLYSPLGPIS
jgi:hypothetical protein